MTSQSKLPKTEIVLFLSFWGLYFLLGLLLASTGAFGLYDVMFGTDTPRIIQYMTSMDSAWFSRSPNTSSLNSGAHILFVLFFNPIGVLFSKIIWLVISGILYFDPTGILLRKLNSILAETGFGSFTDPTNRIKTVPLFISEVSALTSSVLLNSLFGALCVLLVYVFFKKVGLKSSQAILYSVILGLSSAHLFFGLHPETFIFGASSIILGHLLAVTHPEKLVYFVPAGLVCFGVTITNFFQSIVAYWFSFEQSQSNPKRLRKLIVFILLVVIISLLLSILQKIIYPNASLFFSPKSENEALVSTYSKFFFKSSQILDFLKRIVVLLGYIFIYNFVAPKLDISWKSNIPWVDFDTSSIVAFHPPGIIASLIWLALLLWSIYRFIKFGIYKLTVVKGLALCILFNFVLHVFFGDVLFLYSPHWTFLLIACIAFSLSSRDVVNNVVNRSSKLLVAFLIVQSLNNLYFVYDLFSTYHTKTPPG